MQTLFILYSRSYCHLCDDMLLALAQCADSRPFAVEVIDVDNEPVLLARYDELVPALMGRSTDGRLQQLCHHFLDPDTVVAFFEASTAFGLGP